jgi:hypothetical protein
MVIRHAPNEKIMILCEVANCDFTDKEIAYGYR